MARTSDPRVKHLLEEVLTRAPADRAGFLVTACGGDEDLRREVASLAAAGEEAGAFLQSPAAVSHPPSSMHDSSHWQRSPRATRLNTGALINGRYRVEQFAGEGGMGAVYRVYDTARSRTLALKTMSGQAPFVNLFKIEFRTLASLRHPHLAQSHDFEPVVGTADFCFTMDFVEGSNILDATAGAGWTTVVDLMVQLCRALAYVHSRGIIHHDIKPNNVLVDAAGTLKLVDFGLVGSASNGSQVIGTPAYLAPELFDGSPGDRRGDLYSLGVLAYHLLCRHLPFSSVGVAEVLHHRTRTPAFPDHLDVPPWLRDVVLRLCATNPADRFRGGNEVIEAINRGGKLSYPIETTATSQSYVVSGRFVGRDAELAALSAHVERRLHGAPPASHPLLFVGGQSGVGKTRLVGELRHQLQVDRHTFVEGRCFEGAAMEFGAFSEAIVQLASLIDANDGGALVGRHAGELVKLAPTIGRGRAITPALPLISSEAEKRRLLDTAAAFLVEAADLSPYVLSLDDLQWAPHGTVELLRYLLRRIALREGDGEPVRLAMLCTYRDDEIAGRPIAALIDPPQPGADVLGLKPLPAASMQRLMCSMFGLDDIPRNFVTRVLDEAGGSPFFLEEVIRALVENGTVFVEDGTWRTATAIQDLEIPASLVAAVQRRLETVTSPGQRYLLHLMAAHKKPMTATLLAAITGESIEDTQDVLRALTVRHLVAPEADTAQTYRAAHDQVRTTAYADLGSHAPALHGQIAGTIERMSTDADRPLSELAYHWWLAGEPEPALRYALLAGRFALSVYANDEAIEHLEHALTLLPVDRTPLRAEVTEQLADAHFLAGHYGRAKQLLAEVAGSAASATIDRVRIQRKLADVVGYQDGTPGEAVEILWTAAGLLGARRPRSLPGYLWGTAVALGLHFLRQLVTPVRRRAAHHPDHARLAELSLVYLRLGYFSVFADPLRIFLLFFRAANVADRLGESAEHCRAYSMVAVSLGALGLSERSVRVAEGAVAEAGRLGSPWQLANAHSYLAMMLLQAGRWPQAIENAERARDGFATCGDHLELAICAYHLIETIHVRGDLPAARARGRAELEIFERLGLQIIGKGLYIVVGRVLAKTGDDEGLMIGRDALARAERGGDKLSAVMALVALGDGYLHSGRIGEAIEHLERAITIRDDSRFDMYIVAETGALLAQAYAAQWRANGGSLTKAASKAFERSVAHANAAGRRFGPMKSLAALAQGLRHRVHGRPRRAIADFDDAARLASGLGAKLWEAEARLEGGLAWLELEGRGSKTGQASLETALAFFRECGARPAEQRATAALDQSAGSSAPANQRRQSGD